MAKLINECTGMGQPAFSLFGMETCQYQQYVCISNA